MTTLKRQAVLGTPMTLSDMQLIDSTVMLECFADRKFGATLTANSRWLSFRAQPPAGVVGVPRRAELVLSGLRRTQSPGWQSSAFENTDHLRDLAARLLEQQLEWSAPALLDEVVASSAVGQEGSAADRRLARGLVRALGYFMSAPDLDVAPSPVLKATPTYYDVIREAIEVPGLDPEHYRVLAQTLTFVDRVVPDPARRGARSLLQTQLAMVDPSQRPGEIWHTVVHAWNVALTRSLGARGGIHGALPHQVPISTYVEDVSDAVVPRADAKRVLDELGRVMIDDYDFGSLTWSEVAAIASATAETREQYVDASEIAGIADDSGALDHHREAIGRALSERGFNLPPAGSNVLTAIFLGEFMLHRLLGSHGPVGFGTLGASIYERAREGFQLLKKYQVVSTLRRKGGLDC
jgi:hypothetical protein